MKLRINPLALEDLKQIKAYISEELQNPDSALRIVREITERYSKLVDFPYMGAPLSGLINIKTDFRYLVCDSYIVFYKVSCQTAPTSLTQAHRQAGKDYISIYRVLSSRQDYMRVLFMAEEHK